ncbi:hypothetical protein DEO72_LG8g2677 [Vigna unguiculata]|uniref:Uncharacterized protein n=1 Tax=Vigna unguiculata TaxID=3917 RepID=A0A4D6MSY8_VIGUN|nr:hypothetical protein DEO72_LG8g2677 [Vigna unguiculata]
MSDRQATRVNVSDFGYILGSGLDESEGNRGRKRLRAIYTAAALSFVYEFVIYAHPICVCGDDRVRGTREQILLMQVAQTLCDGLIKFLNFPAFWESCCAKRSSFNVLVGMVPTVRTSWLGRDDTGQSHLLGPGWYRPTPTPRRKLIIEGGSSQLSEFDDEEAHDEDDYYFSMVKTLTKNDINSSKLYLETSFAVGGLDCSTKSIYLKSYRSMVSSSPRYFKDGSRPLLECLVLMM